MNISIDVQTGERTEYSLTEEEIVHLKEAEAERIAAIPYTEKRVMEYPPITDYIDGIVKGDLAQVNRYISACLAVKAKYPKPRQ